MVSSWRPGSMAVLFEIVLVAFSFAVALSGEIAAVAWFCKLTIWTNACLRVHAPKQTVVARRNARVALGINKETLPAKRGTQVRMAGIKP